MAAKGDILQLRKEVEKLRETDTKLKSQKLCCQKAKEWFLLKDSKFVADHTLEEGSWSLTSNLPNECKKDVQFSEILGLLSEVKKEEKRLLMLKHQLHSAQMQQEVGLLNDVLLKQSVMVLHSPHDGITQSQDNLSPLSAWFAEIAQSRKTDSADKFEGKFSETSQLFYNVHYCDGTRQPQDLLVETIYKKKFQRDLRKKAADVETLEFSTCHKGFCVQISVSRSEDPSYHIHCDIHLNGMKERLLEYLISRKLLEDLVRQYIWRELDNLPNR